MNIIIKYMCKVYTSSLEFIKYFKCNRIIAHA